MGLAASQARLLTLTSRQHSIEGEAQRIMANKLRLANDTDAAYSKYIAALDETHLQTAQINNDGKRYWIDASMNNLLRYGAASDTSGNTFFVQDITSGKLYMPEEIYRAYYKNIDASGDMNSFVEMFEELKYKQVDLNEDIVNEYNRTLANGYDTILASNYADSMQILNNYYNAIDNDKNTIEPANMILNYLPKKSASGLYLASSGVENLSSDYNKAIRALISQVNYTELYSQDERNLIEGSLLFCDSIDNFSYSDEHDKAEGYFSYDVYYNSQAQNVSKNGTTYVNGGENLSGNNRMAMTLNGGTQTFSARRNVIVKYDKTTYLLDIDESFAEKHPIYKNPNICNLELFYESFNVKYKTHSNIDITEDISQSRNIYDISFELNGTTTTINQLLSKFNGAYSNVGEAIESIVKRTANKTPAATTYLNSINKNESDIRKFKEYLNASSQMQNYAPEYVWVPNDEKRAAYYEEIYKSIQAAGGCIKAEESQAQSVSWVSNMIKSNQVVLTMWDTEEEMLSQTSSALNVNIKEVTDNNYIERISQEYEDTLSDINSKDVKFDKRLAILETERNAIVDEMESLKNVAKNNVETYFKLFG